MGTRVGLDGCGEEKYLAPTGVRTPDRSGRSELLYVLNYPGP